MTKKKKKTEISFDKRMKIVWESGEDIPYVFANQLYISHGSETEFHLIFGHLSPPIIHGLEESDLPDSISVKPVAKIVLTPEAMKSFVKAMMKNLEMYDKKIWSEKDDS